MSPPRATTGRFTRAAGPSDRPKAAAPSRRGSAPAKEVSATDPVGPEGARHGSTALPSAERVENPPERDLAALRPAFRPTQRRAAPEGSILWAWDHPQLFGPHFAGESWGAWKAFLAALFALPMTDVDLALYRQCTGRTAPPTKAFKEAALIIGRRGGKSRVLATCAVFLACVRDYTPFLAPGEVATVMVIASDKKQARSIFRFITGLMSEVPHLAPMMTSTTEESITLNNRVVIEIGTASFRVTRGYSFAAVLADEVAFWRSEESANPDVEVLRALRPGMTTIPGSMLLLASSPYAKKGELYNVFRRHHGKDGARVLVWKAATHIMNPSVDPAEIAEAYEDDPEAARAEYGAEFRDDLADFVTREIVDAVTAVGRHELPPMPGVTYSAFADPSGGVGDSMTLAIGHLRDGEIAVLDAVLEVRPPFDPEKAVADCTNLLKRYNITRIIGDRYAGEWPRARFREHGIDLEQSARPKSDIYIDLLPLLNAKRVELLENPRLMAQLVGLERRTARSGKDSVDHSPGGHDDIANAVAGVLVNLDLDRRPPLVARSQLLHGGVDPVPIPPVINAVFAVVATDETGNLAIVYAGVPASGDVKLIIIDFDAAPIGATLLRDIRARLDEITTITRVRFGALKVFAPESLIGHRPDCVPIPDAFMTPDTGTLLRAAEHIGRGAVKMAAPALDRARTSPIHGALDFRAGDNILTPLRLAIVQAVTLALEQRP